MVNLTENLEHLRNWVATKWDEIPKEKKNLTYRRHGSKFENTTDVTDDLLKANECKTTGCILGWYTTEPNVIAKGFTYNPSLGVIVYEIANEFREFDLLATIKFFNITEDDFNDLFLDYSYGDYDVPEAYQILEKLDAIIEQMKKRPNSELIFKISKLQIGDSVYLRNDDLVTIKQIIHAPNDLVGDYAYLIEFEGYQPRSYTSNGFYDDEYAPNDLDIVARLLKDAE